MQLWEMVNCLCNAILFVYDVRTCNLLMRQLGREDEGKVGERKRPGIHKKE
jgi:hypothetical protein